MLLGNEPSDFDVATSATPEEVRKLFGHTRSLPVGLAFGVVIVLGPRRDGSQVEVATFRTDSTYSDGRRPDSVTFSTSREDAQRRDFTINGMFFDPLENRVIDHVGGQEDLRLGIVRAIGSPHLRIAEDKLRMLRAVRFAARFGFEIEEQTRAAIHDSAAQVKAVSGERIAVEIQKTLNTPRAPWAVNEWYQSRLLDQILPEVVEPWSDHRVQYTNMLDLIADSNWRGKLSVLLYLTEGKAEQLVGSIKERLHLSNADCNAIRFAVEAHPVLAQASRLPWSSVQPVLIHPDVRLALTLLEATSALGDSGHSVEWIEKKLRLPPEQLDPPQLLTGADLIKIGMRPSPQFKQILGAARVLQLDGHLPDRQAALQWANQWLAYDSERLK